jgi:hypothetical protein
MFFWIIKAASFSVIAGSAVARQERDIARLKVLRPDGLNEVEEEFTGRSAVNRLPNLTPDRRPILTLLSDGFGR